MGVASQERVADRTIEAFRRQWDTPRKLRAVLLLAVALCLVSGAVAAPDVERRRRAIRDIEARSAPLSADAVEVYRSLADADAAVATEFLSTGAPADTARARFDTGVARAADLLARASVRAGGRELAADRIADVASQLPVYAALVERARAGRAFGDETAALDDLRRASVLMQSTLLRRAEGLQRAETIRLDAQFERAGAFPGAALASGVGVAAALVLAHVFVSATSRRVLNVGLMMAALALVGALAWSMVAVDRSRHSLGDAQRHSRLLTDALGQAQIAALQARASEILGLVVGEGPSHEEDFSTRMQRLSRENGMGGALGAARRLASETASRQRVDAAIENAAVWATRHSDVRALYDGPRQSEAVNLALQGHGDGSAAAFDDLSSTLAEAVTVERASFRREIHESGAPLAGLVMGTAVLAVVAAAGVAWGIGQRLKEYT
jgi:hypothetical protein